MLDKRIRFLLLAIPICTILALLLYQLPPVYNRLSWRFDNLRSKIWYWLNPPEEVVFVPQSRSETGTPFEPESQSTLTPTPTVSGATLTPTNTSSPTVSPIPTQTPTLLPERVVLTGVIHEYQQMNNCGPATLSMALSFWGWRGDQRDTRDFLRPNYASVDDKNVSPFELVNFVESQTDFTALMRVGGDIEMLKALIAAGFPVIVEKGFQPPKEDWMGHYELITGYDDARMRFITQDAYIMADFPVPYEDLSQQWWRDFNSVYVIVYPPDRQDEVLSILGAQANPAENFQHAAQKAAEETQTLTGRDLFFAWYNLGTNQTALQDYAGAAQAYDQAFSLYASLPQEERPWRMLWYQVGPYEAYYHTGRYQDVINLANQTLSFLQAPILEESLYWRGLAKEALGDIEGAILDLKQAADINSTSTDVLAQLERLGVSYP